MKGENYFRCFELHHTSATLIDILFFCVALDLFNKIVINIQHVDFKSVESEVPNYSTFVWLHDVDLFGLV